MRSRLEALSRALATPDRPDGADARRSRTRRRSQGAYFTPAPLVDFVVAEALAARARAGIEWGADGVPALTVLDPACGDGRFLEAALGALTAMAASRGADPERVRALVARRCLVGVERDPEFAAEARRAVPGATVHCAEALLSGVVAEGTADLVVGNPPYLRSVRWDDGDRQLREALRGTFAATERGEWDLYAVFLERALDWARDGGEIGLVVPSRWWTAACAAPLRARFARARCVRALVDFGGEQVFAGATTYASLAFLSRRPQARVAVARRGEGWELGRMAAGSLGAAPWRLSVGARRQAVERLAGGPLLGDVARIAKGTGTNADAVYLFDGPAPVEDELLRPVVRGRDVRAFGRVDPGRRLLIPYDQAGALIPPERLRARYPRAYAHLEGHRARLEARERGRFRGERFYCFGRPQNLVFLGDVAPKVVVPDVSRTGRALLDTTGAMVLDSAYAIRLSERAPASLSLAAVLAVLGSAAVRLWLRETGVVLRGGYLRMKTAYLRSLPLPAPGPALDRAARAAVSADANAEEIDELVRRAYRLSADEWAAARG